MKVKVITKKPAPAPVVPKSSPISPLKANIDKQTPAVPKSSPILPWNSAQRIALNSKKLIKGENVSVAGAVKSAAAQTGLSPAFLLKSAWQEGMSKILEPITQSVAYEIAEQKNPKLLDYPVDGFYYYGTDTFGDAFPRLKAKGYLPKDFEQKFQQYQAINEKKETVNTAAFKTHRDALMAKAAMLRDAQDQVEDYAKKRGISLGEQEKAYFTSASYNSGFGRGKQMIEEYINTPNKKEFIKSGLTSLKGIHKNIYPRVSELEVLSKEFNQ